MSYHTNMLTEDQIKANIDALEKQGAKPQEIQGWLDSLPKQTNTQNTESQTLQDNTQQTFGSGLPGAKQMTGQQFTDQPKIQQIAQAFVHTLPKDVYDFFIAQPVEFAKSLAEAIPTIATGGKVTPQLGGYVSEAKNAADQGQGLVKSALIPAVKTVATGLTTGAEAQGALNLGKKLLTSISDKEALNQVTSSLNKAGKESVTKTGSPLTGVKRVASATDKEVAQIAKPFLSKNPVQSENAIKNAISSISTKKILPTIEQFSTEIGKTNKTTLVNSIKDIKPFSITKGDPTRVGVFNDFMDRITSAVANAKNDKELFTIRQTLDSAADVETGGKIWGVDGKISPISEAWREARRVINGFLGNRIPNLQDNLYTQSKLYDALEGIQEKTGKLLGKPGTLGKTLKTAGKIAVGSAITGAGFGEGFNVVKKLTGQ